MASAGARLLLVCACLLAAAALRSRDPDAPAGIRASQEPMPKKKPPEGALESRARLNSGSPEPTPQPGLSLNPWDTWLWFLRHSDKEDRAKDRKSKPSLPGPPEPCGVQGPTGTTVPLEGQKLQQLLKAAAERLRENVQRRPAQEEDEEEEEEEDPALVVLLTPDSNRSARARVVEAAFHCRLRRNVLVGRRALHELGGYYLPQAEGTFYRGLGLNLTSGQYTVSVAGFYALAATLHVALPEQRRPEVPRPGSRLRLLICIQSRCQHNASLETVVSRPTGTELFTISVSGVLYLKRRQYISVFLDNASGAPVTVRSGSHFSALFLGI